MFRIDFSARIIDDDGKEKLILIELQKTWLETETLRFRQYPGAQYSDKRNIRKDCFEGYAIPMVTIYLLGHRLGDVDEPVVYVNHKSYDYDGKEIKKGMPDPFIESLVHNSIIVQIPLLHGQINNRLDKVLSVFDQTKTAATDPHLLNLDETEYHGDDNMEYLVHRLTQAAASAELRQDMNVEDEFFSALENRDTEIMARDKRINELDRQIEEQNKSLEESKKDLAESKKILAESKKNLAEMDKKIKSLAIALKKNGMSIGQIAEIIGLTEQQTQTILGL